MAWLEPELDDGADDGLLRPPEPELLDPLDRDEPELPDVPEVPEPVDFPDEEDPEEAEPDEEEPEDDADPEDAEAVLWVEPGRVKATAPAATRLARPTAPVVALVRLRPRSRAATARATVSRSWLLMDAVWYPALGGCYAQVLSQL